jgi:hypothetical protein
VLQVIALAGALFTLPDQAMTALDRYDVWRQRLLLVTNKAPHEQKLLPSPAAILPTPNSEQELPKGDGLPKRQ